MTIKCYDKLPDFDCIAHTSRWLKIFNKPTKQGGWSVASPAFCLPVFFDKFADKLFENACLRNFHLFAKFSEFFNKVFWCRKWNLAVNLFVISAFYFGWCESFLLFFHKNSSSKTKLHFIISLFSCKLHWYFQCIYIIQKPAVPLSSLWFWKYRFCWQLKSKIVSDLLVLKVRL